MTDQEQAADLAASLSEAAETTQSTQQESASLAPPVGSGAHDRFVNALKSQKAAWQQDGKGLRGDAAAVTNAVANLNFPTATTFRRPMVDIPDAANPQ